MVRGGDVDDGAFPWADVCAVHPKVRRSMAAFVLVILVRITTWCSAASIRPSEARKDDRPPQHHVIQRAPSKPSSSKGAARDASLSTTTDLLRPGPESRSLRRPSPRRGWSIGSPRSCSAGTGSRSAIRSKTQHERQAPNKPDDGHHHRAHPFHLRKTHGTVWITITRSAAARKRCPLQRAVSRPLVEDGFPLVWGKIPIPSPHRVRHRISEAPDEDPVRKKVTALVRLWEDPANRVNERRDRTTDDLHQRRDDPRSVL